MASKKKKSNNSVFIIALLLIVVMAMIWYMTSDGGFLSFTEDEPEVSDNTDNEPVVEEEEPLVVEPDGDDVLVVDQPEEETPDLEEPEVEVPVDNSFDETGFDLTVDTSTLSNEMIDWTFRRNSDHEPIVTYSPYSFDELAALGTYYRVDTDEKVVYLTFDEGYENGYTPAILDTLLEYNVKAAFFVTEHFIESNPDLVVRMKEEGHIVGNHSANHPTDITLLSDEEVEQEIIQAAETMAELTGYDMDKFFRPPAARYSERTLYITRRLGYRSIFYGMAYKDWLVDEQPGADVALDHVLTNYFDGCIILLHAVSESNTLALPDIIEEMQALGYRFGQLYEVE